MEIATLGKLLAAIICGLFAGLLAKRKNRNPWGWGIAGALSFLVALLILAFMPYKCPKCGQSLTNDQGKEEDCPSCGPFNSKSEMVAANPTYSKYISPDQEPIQPSKQIAIPPADEEAIYERAAQEVGSAAMKQGLWAKFVAETDGDERIAKARYIKARSQQLLGERMQQLQKEYELQLVNSEAVKRAAVIAQQKIDDAAPEGNCPNCGAIIRTSATKCSSCSAIFSGVGSWKPIPLNQSSRQKENPNNKQMKKSESGRGITKLPASHETSRDRDQAMSELIKKMKA